MRIFVVLAALAASGALIACGAAERERPPPPPPQPIAIGHGPRYLPPSLSPAARAGRPIGALRCGPAAGRRFGVHLELFARGRVVIVPPGIGVAPPRVESGAYVPRGRCSYPLRTREPTGVIEVTAGARTTLAQFFAVWGQSLGPHALAGFRPREPVRAYLGGRRFTGDPRSIALSPHAEIVLEAGAYVVPHARYGFAQGL